jgi:cell wall-associated protease
MKYSILSILLLGSLASAKTTSLKPAASHINAHLIPGKTVTSTLIVEFAAAPSEDLKNWVARIPGAGKPVRLAPKTDTDYFKRAYRIEVTGNLPAVIAQLTSSEQIVNVETVGKVEMYSVEPSKGTPVTNDPLVNYQWAFNSSGQIVNKEVDDLNSTPTVQDPNGPSMDVGAIRAKAKLAQLKRDVVVAVIDSGIDLNHPDLDGAIFKNEKECVDGKIPFQATEDKDGNGFIGDCMGWNFSGRTPEGTNNPDDNSGHGTHVSGIMAAISGNGIGISGVSNRIKILPIKTSSPDPEEETEKVKLPGEEKNDKNPRKEVTYTDRIVNAMLYAVKMKVDVINFSLGWPISYDTEYLRQAFAEAKKAGIIVIAAAGNNTSAVPVFPCSYEGVICVGAVDIDGSISSFSNYGAQVDLVGPGEGILSTYPTALDTQFFQAKGYDLKNGTSQAAPYVAAQAALLRSMNPSISTDEVYARLAVSAKPVKWGTKYGMGGNPDLEKSLSVSPRPVVRPEFKTVSQVSFSKGSRSFGFSLPIKNYWASASNVKVSISIDKKYLSIDQATFNLGSIGQGEIKRIAVNGHISDSNQSREAKVTVTIAAEGQPAQSYVQTIFLTRKLDGDSDLKTHVLALLKDRPKLVLASMLVAREDDAFPEYVLVEPAEGGLAISVVRYRNDSFREEKPIVVPNGIGLGFAIRADLDYDGHNDYLFASTIEVKGQRSIVYTMLKDDFTPVIKGQPFVPVLVDGTILPTKALLNQFPTFTQFNTPQGKLATFVFNNVGRMPKEDTKPNSLDFEENEPADRFYFYEPRIVDGQYVLATRNYDNAQWAEKMRAQLKLRAREDVEIAEMMPQPDSDFAKGIVHMLVKIGSSSMKTYKLLTVTGGEMMKAHDYTLSDTNFDGQSFDGSELRATIKLDQPIPEYLASPAYSTLFTLTEARITQLDPSGGSIVNTTKIHPNRVLDSLLGFTQSYSIGDTLISFFKSKSQLIVKAQPKSGAAVQDQQPIDRTAMIPDYLFEPFVITSGTGPVKAPALYVDSHLVLAKRVFIWRFDGKGLTAPMMMNVEMPDGCQALAPRHFGNNGEFAYMLLCRDEAKAQWALKTLTVQ